MSNPTNQKRNLDDIFADLKKEKVVTQPGEKASYQFKFTIDDQLRKNEILDRMLLSLKQTNLQNGMSCYVCGTRECKCL